jgi:hypothetical protein
MLPPGNIAFRLTHRQALDAPADDSIGFLEIPFCCDGDAVVRAAPSHEPRDWW